MKPQRMSRSGWRRPSGPAVIETHGLCKIVEVQLQHQQPVQPQRNAGAIGQAMVQGVDQVLIIWRHIMLMLAPPDLIGFETLLLLGGVRQFVKTIGQFQAVPEQLES